MRLLPAIPLLLVPVITLAQAGTLDPSFSTDGLQTTDLLSLDDEVHAVAVQPDGKVIGAGWTEDGKNVFAFVQRLLENGTPDPSFGLGGAVHAAAAGERRYAYAVGLQSTGRIIVAGLVYDVNMDGNALLLGYLPNGTLDAAFGTDGMVSTSFGAEFGFQSAWAMAILPDDRIVLVGEEGENGIACARLTADGDPDPSFGTNGLALVGVPFSSGLCVKALEDGSVLVGGYRVAGDSDLLLAKFDADGVLDPAFGVDGITLLDLGGGDTEFMRGLDVLADGRIAVCGSRSFAGLDDEPIVALFEADGDPDPGFGTDGLQLLPYTAPQWGQARALIAQPGNNLLVAGFRAQPGTMDNNDFFLMRLLDDGSLDPTFAGGGLVHTDVNSSADRAFAMALAPNGAIVLGGYSGTTQRLAAYARYLNDTHTGLAERASVDRLNVFPVPAVDHFVVSAPGLAGMPCAVLLHATDGSLVFTTNAVGGPDGRLRIELPTGLSSGSYALAVRTPHTLLRTPVSVFGR